VSAVPEKFNPRRHTGVGYGFKAYAEGLTWEYLPESTDIHGHGQIYGDMIFHLLGTARKGLPPQQRSVLPKSGYVRVLQKLDVFMPQSAKQWFETRFRVLIEHLTKKPMQRSAKKKFAPTRKALLEDPEAYLDSLRRRSPG
jgi:hypothetical protein